MQPIKINFELAAPLLIDSECPIHFDALIAYAVSKELEESGHANPWDSAAIESEMEHYLEKTEGASWVWKASKILYQQDSELLFINTTRKSQPDLIFDALQSDENPDGVVCNAFTSKGENKGFKPETFKVDTTSGKLRGYQWLATATWVSNVHAYCIGDPDGLDYLLRKHIFHIGKASRNGYGRIKTIQIEADESAQTDWQLRILPMEEPGKQGEIYAPLMATVRAPYWDKTKKIKAKEYVGG